MDNLKRTCPKDGAAMVVTQNEAMGINFICPVCGVNLRHDEFNDDTIQGEREHESKNDGLLREDQTGRAQD